MKNTKTRILEASISLLNEHGFANVSLPQIAKKLGISLGNLTYHFPKKEQLVERIYDMFRDDLTIITKEYQPLVDLAGIDLQLQAFYKFQEKYRFFYLDLLELNRAYPAIAERHHPYVEGHIKGIYNYFIFNVGSGNLQSFDNLEVYEKLAHQFWMTIVFFRTQLAFRGKTGTQEEMRTDAWALVFPYLTEKGKNQLQHIIDNNKKIHSPFLK